MSRKPMGKIEGATPEQVAQAIFAAATPPDPTKRKQRTKRKRTVTDEISFMPRVGKDDGLNS